MTAYPIDRLIELTHGPALFGLTVLVHSTVVLTAGLVGLKVLTLKGTAAGARSALIRICLAVAMITPVTAMISSHFHMPRFTITAPIPAPVERSHAYKDAISPVLKQEVLSQESTPLRTTPRDASLSPAPPGHAGPAPSSSTPRAGHHTTGFRTPAEFMPVLFVFAWAALTLFLAFRAGVVFLYYHRMRRFSVPADDRHIELCRSVAGELGTTPSLVLKNRYVTGAFITGCFHPAIIIPSGGMEHLMTTREVFLHEIAHVVRRDHIWLHIGQVGRILLSIQPLVWMLVHDMEETSDFACDDYVLRATGKQHDYAGQLVELAVSMRSYPLEAGAGTGIFSRGTHLRRRIEYILDNSLARRFSPNAAEAVSFTLLFLCTLTFTGLVGVRGKTLAQMKTLPEAISRAATTVAAATVTAMKEQVQAVFAPIVTTEPTAHGTDATEPGSPLAVETASAAVMDAVSSSGVDDPLPSVDEDNHEMATTPIDIQIAGEISSTIPSSGPAAPVVSNPSPLPKEKPAFVPPVQGTSTTGSFISPAMLETSSSRSAQTETVTAKTGALTVTVPSDTPSTLLESLERGQENPVWSPTGRIIAFTGKGGNGIWTVSANGGEPVLVFDTTSDNSMAVPRSSVRILSFSPSGDVLAYVRYATITPAEGAKKESAVHAAFIQAIETVNIHTGERRVLVKSAVDGCWSPDGRSFVYVEGDGYGIRMLDTVTGETRRVTESGSSPTFTPDGASIIYTSWGGGIYDQLYRIPSTGGNPEQLTYEGCWLNPRCSPDGKWVLCSGSQNGESSVSTWFRALNLNTLKTFEIYIVRTGTATMGTWSPNGNQYCFALAYKTSTAFESVSRSGIYIEDFPIGSILDSMGTSSLKPAEFKLIGNFPNPFNTSTSIRFSVSREGPVELSVYAMNGQKVRDLVSEHISAGEHTIQWDGRDRSGKKVSSGVYISRLKMEREVETHRMTLLK